MTKINSEVNLKEKIKDNRMLTIFVLISLGLFCWFQIRPAIIKSSCTKISKERARELLKNEASLHLYDIELQNSVKNNYYRVATFNNVYSVCLKEKGL